MWPVCALLLPDAALNMPDESKLEACMGAPSTGRTVLQLAATDELEGKFQRLEGDNVDDELRAMKRGMLNSGNSSSSSSSSSRDRSLPEGRPIRCACLDELTFPRMICLWLHFFIAAIT